MPSEGAQDMPDLQCCACDTPILRAADILSSGYRGHSGAAYLARSALNTCTSSKEDEVSYTSGTYRVRDVSCKNCGKVLGTTYVGASEKRNSHKVGKFLLGQSELRRPVAREASCEDSSSTVGTLGSVYGSTQCPRMVEYWMQGSTAPWSAHWQSATPLPRPQVLFPRFCLPYANMQPYRIEPHMTPTGVVTPPIAVSPGPAEKSDKGTAVEAADAAGEETVVPGTVLDAPAEAQTAAGAAPAGSVEESEARHSVGSHPVAEPTAQPVAWFEELADACECSGEDSAAEPAAKARAAVAWFEELADACESSSEDSAAERAAPGAAAAWFEELADAFQSSDEDAAAGDACESSGDDSADAAAGEAAEPAARRAVPEDSAEAPAGVAAEPAALAAAEAEEEDAKDGGPAVHPVSAAPVVHGLAEALDVLEARQRPMLPCRRLTVAPLPLAAVRTASAPSSAKRAAAYYGICDLKYDRRRPRGSRLVVLELGNGRSSRFSGCGECIPRNFQKYRLASPLDRSLLVENKKMTHDVFVESGFEHLRPKQVCFPRVYTQDLAQEVLASLGLSCESSSLVVLKLVNRCRGAGVVVVRGSQLDATLQLLLSPPSKKPRASRGSLDAALALDPASLREQCLHWWSNECPVFVAELCVSSHPTSKDGQDFDGTLRVGFVLLGQGEYGMESLGVDFLGGYWKLPAEPVSSGDTRARCVSKARIGTAPVSTEDLADVCAELRVALPAVFASERTGMVTSLMRRYAQEPLAFSFALARHAASKVQQKVQEQAKRAKGQEDWCAAATRQTTSLRGLFDMAEARLMGGFEDLQAFRESLPRRSLPTRAVASYIERQLGVLDAQLGDWDGAQGHFGRALELHPWNASAEYLMGLCYQRKSEHAMAQASYALSIMLDPDFKAPYVNLGAAALALGDWARAAKVSTAGLQRHPQAFHCSYNLGLALAHQLQHGPDATASVAEPVTPKLQLARAPDVDASVAIEERQHVQCARCSTPLFNTEDILSSGYRVVSGPAYFTREVYNVRPMGLPQHVTYATGKYDVQDVSCIRCNKNLGIQYVGATERRNLHKVGSYLIGQKFTVKKTPVVRAAEPEAAFTELSTSLPRDESPAGVRTPPVAQVQTPSESAEDVAGARILAKAAAAAAVGPAAEPEPALAEQKAGTARRSAVELRRAKEQKEQSKTEWSKKDDALLELVEKLSAEDMGGGGASSAASTSGHSQVAGSFKGAERLEAAEHPEAMRAQLAAALASCSGWTVRNFRP